MSLSNSIVRVLTALVAIPIMVWLTWLGGWPFLVLIVACALLGQVEFYQMASAGGMAPLRIAGLMLGLLIAIRSVFPLPLAFGAVAVAVMLIASHLSNRPANPPQSVAITLLGIVYPTLMLTYMVDIRAGGAAAVGQPGAFWLTMSVFILVWVSDTAAYYVGRAFGKRKLAPQISPNKTWEGALGGSVGSIAVAAAMGMTVLAFVPMTHCLVLGIICGSIGQLGDLAESRIKRLVGVKDSGSIIPGHGGVLDRFDALTVVAPISYFYLFYVARVL
ncbi:MAG: phosphatidate cytidylyltransferase [Rhodothermia bacterium]|nr:phosphatidate cytidylyltransferase [Rhodothermia bacterium]